MSYSQCPILAKASHHSSTGWPPSHLHSIKSLLTCKREMWRVLCTVSTCPFLIHPNLTHSIFNVLYSAVITEGNKYIINQDSTGNSLIKTKKSIDAVPASLSPYKLQLREKCLFTKITEVLLIWSHNYIFSKLCGWCIQQKWTSAIRNLAKCAEIYTINV